MATAEGKRGRVCCVKTCGAGCAVHGRYGQKELGKSSIMHRGGAWLPGWQQAAGPRRSEGVACRRVRAVGVARPAHQSVRPCWPGPTRRLCLTFRPSNHPASPACLPASAGQAHARGQRAQEAGRRCCCCCRLQLHSGACLSGPAGRAAPSTIALPLRGSCRLQLAARCRLWPGPGPACSRLTRHLR